MSCKSIFYAFLSCLFICFMAVSSAVMFCMACCIWMLTRFFDPRLILLNLFSSFWASMYIACMPMWSVKIIGRDKLDISKSYVFVSNHQSQLDILLAYRLFFPFRWISKIEIFRVPFIGWNMALNGYVGLKRGDKDSIDKMMRQCEKLLEKNVSVILFPEGTRSRTGILRPFKPGAFILAKKMKKNIVPLVINNTIDALPKHSMRISQQTKMTLRVLDEIDYHQFKDLEIDQISDMVRDKIKSCVTVNPERKSDSITG